VTSVHAIRQLLSDAPGFDKMKPSLEPSARYGQIHDMRSWLERVERETTVLSSGTNIQIDIVVAKQDGEIDVRAMKPVNLPVGIDQLHFSDFFVPAYQCERVKVALQNAIQGIEKQLASTLQRFREAEKARSARG
jgi:hypothetical protein